MVFWGKKSYRYKGAFPLLQKSTPPHKRSGLLFAFAYSFLKMQTTSLECNSQFIFWQQPWHWHRATWHSCLWPWGHPRRQGELRSLLQCQALADEGFSCWWGKTWIQTYFLQADSLSPGQFDLTYQWPCLMCYPRKCLNWVSALY